MNTPNDNFATTANTSVLPIETLRHIYPGASESDLMYFQSTTKPYTWSQSIFREGRAVNQIRIFVVYEGAVELAHYLGSPKDLAVDREKLVPYLTLEAISTEEKREPVYIPISLYSEMGPFTIMPKSHVCIVGQVDERHLEDMLNSPVAENLLRVQSEILIGVAKNVAKLKSNRQTERTAVEPLLALVSMIVKNNPRLAEYAASQLNRTKKSLDDMLISITVSTLHLTDVNTLSRVIAKICRENRSQVEDATCRKIVKSLLMLNQYDPDTRKQKPNDRVADVDFLQKQIGELAKFVVRNT